MRKASLIVSLHFSPAHASHIAAFGMLLSEIGFDVAFLVDDRYLSFYDFFRIGPVIPVSEYKASPESVNAGMALFYNAAVENARVARTMRTNGTRILYVFHEPIEIHRRLIEEWKSVLKLGVATMCSRSMLKETDCVLVPSEYGRIQYQSHYLRYNDRIYTLPLLFDDECGKGSAFTSTEERRWFSYLDNAVKAHHFDEFVALVKHALRAGSNIPFTIATKTNLDNLLRTDNELAQYAKEGKIRIHHGKVMSNGEMNRYYRESFCVWNVYRHTTQSGVLSRAFMAGSPVLASRVGSLVEYIIPGINGEFVSGAGDFDELLRSAEKIRGSISRYVDGARRTFLQKFYYKANRDALSRILEACETASAVEAMRANLASKAGHEPLSCSLRSPAPATGVKALFADISRQVLRRRGKVNG
jgi:glycosyltransferase involved in cell wall biosynthesis